MLGVFSNVVYSLFSNLKQRKLSGCLNIILSLDTRKRDLNTPMAVNSAHSTTIVLFLSVCVLFANCIVCACVLGIVVVYLFVWAGLSDDSFV